MRERNTISNSNTYRCGYHFFRGTSRRAWVLRLLGLSPYTHVVLSLHNPTTGTLYYSTSHGQCTSWYSEDTQLCPSDSLYEDLTLDLHLVDLVLPCDEDYNLTKVILHYITGRPRHTLSCVTAVHRLRYLAGRETRGRTPGSLYRYLRRRID